MTKPGLPLEDRFWPKVEEATDLSPNGWRSCWLWTASLTGNGYGYFGLEKGRMALAHRFAYEYVIGPIPEGMTLDHLCRRRTCVNPAHLEPVSMRENLLRGESPTAHNARKTHCVHGHPLSGENLYVDPRGRRQCKECRRKSTRKFFAGQTPDERRRYWRRYRTHPTVVPIERGKDAKEASA